MEIRSFGENAAPKLVEERTIEGYAVVFGQESRVLYDKVKKRFFVEIIEPGAITDEMFREWDVKALCEHNKERMLARSFKGAGSLALTVDPYGVNYRFLAPNTPDGDYVVELTKRGDLFGSSFAYVTSEENVRYELRKDGVLLRRVYKIDRMFDISPVSDPAYMGTEVSVRSLDEYLTVPSDENYKAQIDELRNMAFKY
ncbi:HK97 family phage prohead protease [Parabacteroides pacaensis]|uniref:HK97 family phage prohead protease n=1 Tax=Parabacteroides pacaensis TaxID=2086575 RepID=UPI000D0EC6D4|nr:HK97 family phage prohead protease [Parabacteroides pacaensis]